MVVVVGDRDGGVIVGRGQGQGRSWSGVVVGDGGLVVGHRACALLVRNTCGSSEQRPVRLRAQPQPPAGTENRTDRATMPDS